MILQPITAGRFDLDDLGLEIAQQHAGHGPRHALREVGDAHAPVGRHAPPPLSLLGERSAKAAALASRCPGS